MLMDGQFEAITGDLAELGITLNTVARGEHVPEAERYIRTIKERVRSCVYNTMPFTEISGRMVAELIYYCVFWLNSFPARDGISSTLSPRAIVTGSHIDFNKHCRLEFGAYVQAHEEHDNTMIEAEFGKEAPLTKTRGNIHEYLGMTIDFSIDGKVRFSMIDYVLGMLDELPEDMNGECATPASNHLFEVNDGCEKLDSTTADFFHHSTAKLLFLCKRARPEATSFHKLSGLDTSLVLRATM